MEAKNIRIDEQFPKSLDAIDVPKLDLIVNMSGVKLPARLPVQVREWKVEDPIGKPEEFYITVRYQIEMSVMRLILELRKEELRDENTPLQGRVSGRARR